MKLIDTHAHIYLEEFLSDRIETIKSAENQGVIKIIMPAIDSQTHDEMHKVEQFFPGICVSMMGLHPCSVKENYFQELEIAAGFLAHRRYIAIGEIGLDFYWDLSYRKQQYDAFHRQVEWALHYNLPVVIHSRNATSECIKLVQEHQNGNLKGVFHCFSGTLEQARQIIEAGLYLGIGGVLTYKKSGLDEIIKQIDLDHIILETDAPYLSPVPYRGKRNECAFIRFTAQKLAELKQIPIEELADITTLNAQKLFGL